MNYRETFISVSFLSIISFFCCNPKQEVLILDNWTYIQVDDARGKWGDWAEPEWLRYFGLDMADMDGDTDLDILAGRYWYRNDGNSLQSWTRFDLGANVDGMLVVDVDNDGLTDLIAEALPAVFWIEAKDKGDSTWTLTEIGEIPQTGHINGQGYGLGDIVQGGKPEILLTAADGIYACQIPSTPDSDKWKWIRIATTASDEGFDVSDLDGDGDLDLIAGDILEGEQENPTGLYWWQNTGSLKETWKRFYIGNTDHAIDRVKIGDINRDGNPDVAISEERWPGLEPDAKLYWFEAPDDLLKGAWVRHEIIQQYSMNNLDVADLDNDGDPDIVTNEHKGETYKLQVFGNDGHGHFTEHVVDTGKESHLGTQLADLDLDGDLDIVSAAWDHYQYLHVWRNDAIK